MKFNLADVMDGHARIRSFEGGDGLQSHLAGMGLVQGITLDVIRNDGSGPMVVRIKNTRIAIGRMMAKKILISKDHHGRVDKA